MRVAELPEVGLEIGGSGNRVTGAVWAVAPHQLQRDGAGQRVVRPQGDDECVNPAVVPEPSCGVDHRGGIGSTRGGPRGPLQGDQHGPISVVGDYRRKRGRPTGLRGHRRQRVTNRVRVGVSYIPSVDSKIVIIGRTRARQNTSRSVFPIALDMGNGSRDGECLPNLSDTKWTPGASCVDAADNRLQIQRQTRTVHRARETGVGKLCFAQAYRLSKDGGPGQAGVGVGEALNTHRQRVAQCDQPVRGRPAVPGCAGPDARYSDAEVRLLGQQRLRATGASRQPPSRQLCRKLSP